MVWGFSILSFYERSRQTWTKDADRCADFLMNRFWDKEWEGSTGYTAMHRFPPAKLTYEALQLCAVAIQPLSDSGARMPKAVFPFSKHTPPIRSTVDIMKTLNGIGASHHLEHMAEIEKVLIRICTFSKRSRRLLLQAAKKFINGSFKNAGI